MSQGQDDYASTSRNPSEPLTSDDVEPADPDRADHSSRRELPLAPDSVKLSKLPDPLCSGEKPLTVAEAGETYLKVQRSNWNSDAFTSSYESCKSGKYRQILDADRQFQAKYDSLTTAMLTRRLSPLGENGNWLTPWECNEMLHGGTIHRSVRDALDYQLDNFEYEWVAVTAPTGSAGTPHEHIYLWIDDPDNEVTTDHIVRARDKHLKHCPNAYEENHQYRTDGTDGAITVQHDPNLRRQSHGNVARQVARGNTSPHANTLGAQYLASQLVHLHIGDYYAPDKETPPKTLFEGAALAWASPYNWFRSSGGVPS